MQFLLKKHPRHFVYPKSFVYLLTLKNKIMSKFKLNQEVFYMCANMPTIGKIVGIAVIVKGDFPIIPKALQPERCVQEKIIYNIGEIYPILVNESQIFATKEDLRYSLFANL